MLGALGHEVHVVDHAVAPDVPSYLSADDATQRAEIAALRDSGVTIHLLRTRLRSRLRYLASAPELRRIVRGVGGDIVLTLYGGGFALLAWASGVRPYVVYVVGSDVLRVRGVARRLSRFVLERAGAVVSNGEFLAARTASLAPRARVTWLYHGLVATDLPQAPQRVATPRLICTRGFLPVYNNAYLVEGLAARQPAAPPIPTTFVANGPDLGRVRALADRILSPGQRAAVSFLGGTDRARLHAELGMSQIYVSLSTSDGTSTSLLEALAAGLFPIVSDIPPNREWIDSSTGNGILVPLNEPDALAAAIERACGDEPLRVRAATFNRSLIHARADARRNIALLAARLQALIVRPVRAAA
jgi:glycosyltransferase involved in cell wall biosynthesis